MQLLRDDVIFILNQLPRDVVDVMRRHPIVLAGGFIRACVAGEDATDIDLWGPSKELLWSCARNLANRRGVKMHETRNAFTVASQGRMPVQFVYRWTYPTAAELIVSFDYTVACAAIWFDRGSVDSVCDDGFYADLAARRLRYRAPDRDEDAGGSILRALKFARRGYHIAPESLGRVVARLVQQQPGGRLRDRGVSHPDMTEAEIAKILSGRLREVDPLTIVDGIEVREDDAVVESMDGAITAVD